MLFLSLAEGLVVDGPDCEDPDKSIQEIGAMKASVRIIASELIGSGPVEPNSMRTPIAGKKGRRKRGLSKWMSPGPAHIPKSETGTLIPRDPIADFVTSRILSA